MTNNANFIIEYPPTKRFSGEEPPPYFRFQYPLDDFQKFGCRAIEQGDNLLVCAHTGSGKTVLALYTFARCLVRGERVIYISPIKTLSNQKYKEFGDHFGSVGILTGDIKMNPDADCLIMTAEILRNFLLGDQERMPSYFSMERVTSVVLDEVHFINNEDRGRVWEEILCFLPSHIQLVLLSATLGKPSQFAEWIGQMRKKTCHLVSTLRRPVPLQHYLYWDSGLHCFLNEKEQWQENAWKEGCHSIRKYFQKNRWSNQIYQESLDYLQTQQMLPATLFLLNRDMVEKIANSLYAFQKDHHQISLIGKRWDHHLHKYAPLYQHTGQWNMVKDLVHKGIGIHHSGLIPILKEMVEILYTEGLLPVLLATETFAMGVNAPIKTVLFTHLEKFDGVRKRSLLPEEYHQMAGRAGRRGLDPAGTVIILPHRDMMSETELKRIVLAPPAVIKSRLQIDYPLILQQILNKTTSTTEEALTATLFYEQNKMALESLRKTFTQVPPEPLGFQEHKESVQETMALEEKLKPDGFIRLDRKIEKTIRKKISENIRHLGEDSYSLYKKYALKKETHELEKVQVETEQKNWDLQIQKVQKGLEEWGFLSSEGSLTRLGVIMREVHDANSLLVSRILDSGLLDDLSGESIVALLSVFVADKERSNEPILMEEVDLSLEEKKCFQQIEHWASEGEEKELDLVQQLPFPFHSDWTLSKKMMKSSRGWYQGKSWAEVSPLCKDFEGNFIKNILRLNNFILSIAVIAKGIQNVKLVQALEGCQEKMIRDIVMTDSLYVLSRN